MGMRKSKSSESLLEQYLEGRLSRAQLFKAATAGLALAAVPSAVAAQAQPGTGAPGTQSFPFFPQVQGTYTPELVTQIVSNLLTTGHFGVTLVATLIRSAGTLGISDANVQALRVALASRQFEIDFWSSLVPEAKPVTTTFTVPPGATSDKLKVAATAEAGATIQVGIYIAAVREFAELGQPTLAKYAAQRLGVQAEGRILTRVVQASLGVTTASPPANKAFETDLFLYTRDVITLLNAVGFINGTGTTIAYPGRDAVLALAGPAAAGVTQRTPNNATTSITAGNDPTAPRT